MYPGTERILFFVYKQVSKCVNFVHNNGSHSHDREFYKCRVGVCLANPVKLKLLQLDDTP